MLGNDVYLELEVYRTQGKVSILIAQEKNCIGVIALLDVLRPDTSTIVTKLKSMCTESVLLSGDNKLTAHHIAQQMDSVLWYL